MSAQRVFHIDGSVHVVDGARGIGLICDANSPERSRPAWRLISCFPRMDKPEVMYFVIDYGRN